MGQWDLDNKIRKHFATDTIINYSSRSGLVHAEDKDIVSFVKKTSNPDSKVLEVGGGSGALLDQIAATSAVTSFYHCEFVAEAYKLQANPNINLIGSTALNLPFRDRTFDYCIAKNLLHHLAGATRKKIKRKRSKSS